MTAPERSAPETVAGMPTAVGPPPAKAPPPPLSARADRPRPVRIRAGAVRAVVGAGVLLVSGSLAWAFVVQPELRRSERARAGELPPVAEGQVRPSDQITDRPSRYDRLSEESLPPPRIGAPETTAEGDPALAAAGPVVAASAAASPPMRPRPADTRRQAAEAAAASGLFFPSSRSGRSETEPDEAVGDATGFDAAIHNPHALIAPRSPWEIRAGTVLPAALLTAVDTSRPGPVVAVVSETVFDTGTGRAILIPQGARLIGRHEGESRYGDRRAFLIWERLVLPNGRSLRLEGAPGVDAQGATGVAGQADRRLLPLAAASLFAGAITALGEFARGGARDDDRGSWLGTAGDAASVQAAEIGGRLIDRELEVRPVIRLRPGARVAVMITRDLVLEPWRS